MKSVMTIPFYDLEGNLSEESLFGELLSNGNFIIKDIPLFVPNLALNDVVLTGYEEGRLFFEKIIKESGNTTIHIVSLKGSLDNLSKIVEKHNGTVRKFGDNYMAVNFQSINDYKKIRPLLDVFESKEEISYKESCLGD